MAVILPIGWSDFETGCCVDSTERGQRILVEELRFTNNDDHGGNTRTSWSYVSPTEEVFTLAGAAGCGGGNMTYSSLCCQMNHFMGPGAPVDHPTLINGDGTKPAINVNLGTSDVPCYSFANFLGAYFPGSPDQQVTFISPSPPFGSFFSFAKKDSRFYGLNASYGGGDSGNHRVWSWDMSGPTGTFDWESNVISTYTASNGCATDSFLYVLLVSGPGQGIAKLNVSNGSLVSIFALDTINPIALFTINDNLIYILCTTGAFYYLKNFTTLVFVGRFSSTITSFSGTGFFANGRFYYGGTGFGGFSSHIYSILLPCPEGAPLIASVSTTTSTVAAGANILVNWDDVLEPNINDRLYLKANDAVLFDTTPLANQQPNTGIGDGSFSFPIPGGTTPGSYVIQFVSRNAYLVATSPPFTVT